MGDHTTARRSRTDLLIIELVVVIVVLAAILIPAIARGREQRRRISCQGNLKQVSLAFKMYAQDWDGIYPPKKRVLAPDDPSGDRYDLVPEGLSIYPEYLTDLKILVCPSDVEAVGLDEWWQGWLESGDAIRDFIDRCSYIYTGYVAYTDDYGNSVAEADSQFLGVLRAIDELGWQDFNSDITLPEESREEYSRFTTGQSGTLYRLREGIGKMLVSDSTDTAQVELAESQIPVMWDALRGSGSQAGGVLLFNHMPGGSNVVFLDGHVEFIEFPGEFPVTLEVADALGTFGRQNAMGRTFP